MLGPCASLDEYYVDTLGETVSRRIVGVAFQVVAVGICHRQQLSPQVIFIVHPLPIEGFADKHPVIGVEVVHLDKWPGGKGRHKHQQHYTV